MDDPAVVVGVGNLMLRATRVLGESMDAGGATGAVQASRVLNSRHLCTTAIEPAAALESVASAERKASLESARAAWNPSRTQRTPASSRFGSMLFITGPCQLSCRLSLLPICASGWLGLGGRRFW